MKDCIGTLTASGNMLSRDGRGLNACMHSFIRFLFHSPQWSQEWQELKLNEVQVELQTASE